MMKIRLLLFAQFREMAGTDELDLQLAEGATAADLVDRLRREQAWHLLPKAPAIAVNRTYAPLTVRLAEGDEVALIPPVAGG
jgi:molybdopterin converting factor subunit 1